MDVVVYRRATVTGGRVVCTQPVFAQGRQRHRPVADRHRPLDRGREQLRLQRARPRPSRAARPRAGHRARRRRRRPARGCRTVWHSDERAPSVVPKLSLANGLVYTYTKPPRPTARTRGTSPRSTSAPADRLQAPRPARASASTTTTRRSASAPTGAATSARSAAWWRGATPRRRPPARRSRRRGSHGRHAQAPPRLAAAEAPPPQGRPRPGAGRRQGRPAGPPRHVHRARQAGPRGPQRRSVRRRPQAAGRHGRTRSSLGSCARTARGQARQARPPAFYTLWDKHAGRLALSPVVYYWDEHGQRGAADRDRAAWPRASVALAWDTSKGAAVGVALLSRLLVLFAPPRRQRRGAARRDLVARCSAPPAGGGHGARRLAAAAAIVVGVVALTVA